jgi:hypothetical protein
MAVARAGVLLSGHGVLGFARCVLISTTWNSNTNDTCAASLIAHFYFFLRFSSADSRSVQRASPLAKRLRSSAFNQLPPPPTSLTARDSAQTAVNMTRVYPSMHLAFPRFIIAA